MALSRFSDRPRSASFIGRCTPSVGKLGRRPMASSHDFVEYFVYGSELSLVEYPEVRGVVLGL